MRLNLKRNLKTLYCKIVRAEGSPEYIARGWAIGMFIGCVIPMSFQLMISIPLSFALRGSKIGATLGTFITNPVTVFFLYPMQIWVGNKVIGGDLSYSAVSATLKDRDIAAIFDMGWDLIISFFIGGFILALICTPITYFLVRHLVNRYRRIKDAVIAKRRNRPPKPPKASPKTRRGGSHTRHIGS